MILVGSVYDATEKEELEFVTKVILVGLRIRELGKKMRETNEVNNKKKSI